VTAEIEVLRRAEMEPTRPLTAGEIRAQVNLIQEVMKGVMLRDVHFGQIPGTPKPTLFKAGAEKILSTFRLAVDYRIEDLSHLDAIRYRVAALVTSSSGLPLGSAVGEASSDEEKYRWRSSVHPKEWDATTEDRKRTKFYKNGNEQRQIRTNPSDVANTILKMACKRALVAATLQVTAASDIFAQDIEDLPDEVREAVTQHDAPASEGARPHMSPPPRKSAPLEERIAEGFKLLGTSDKQRREMEEAFGSNTEALLDQIKAMFRAQKEQEAASADTH